MGLMIRTLREKGFQRWLMTPLISTKRLVLKDYKLTTERNNQLELDN